MSTDSTTNQDQYSRHLTFPEARAESKRQAEIMLAYAEGAELECFHKQETKGKWRKTDAPSWQWSVYDYRIKPETPKQVMIRHYLISAVAVGVLTKNFSESEDAYTQEKESQSFVRFLDDWHPATFPPPSTPL